MTDTEIGIEAARKNLGEIVDRAYHHDETTYLTRHGKRVAAITPIRSTQEEHTVTTYTAEIQASNADGTIWQAMAPAETVTVTDQSIVTALDVAEWVAGNQNVAEGEGWRVLVWHGADADTATQPAAVYAAITYGVYECADGGGYTWRHEPCGKDAGDTWASSGEACRALAKHDAACTNYGFND